MFWNNVVYIYDPWTITWIQKLLKYEKKHWEESIRLRWSYGKERPCSKETFDDMKSEYKYPDVKYIKEEEFNEKFKEFEEKWKKDETFYIEHPGVIGWERSFKFRRLLKYERKWGKEEINYYNRNWEEISCSFEEKLKELEDMLSSAIMWDRWDCYELDEESGNKTLQKWRLGK